jgi:hypothetical protein
MIYYSPLQFRLLLGQFIGFTWRIVFSWINHNQSIVLNTKGAAQNTHQTELIAKK